MMPSDTAHDTVGALGEVGLLQFKDLNTEKSPFQRTFANQVLPTYTACSWLAARHFGCGTQRRTRHIS